MGSRPLAPRPGPPGPPPPARAPGPLGPRAAPPQAAVAPAASRPRRSRVSPPMKLDVAVVSHGTDAFLLNLLESVREHVPADALGEVHVLDNASPDRSLDVLARFSREAPWLAVHASPVNLHHGPALDVLLRRHARADHVLLLDADAEVTGDFLPRLLPLLSSRPAFVGQEHPEPDGFYLYLCHLLVDRRAYLSLPPFARHGAPGLALFAEVARRRLPVSRFRWVDHVRHHGQAALRALRARGESGNELFAFASRQPEASPRRLALVGGPDRRTRKGSRGAGHPLPRPVPQHAQGQAQRRRGRGAQSRQPDVPRHSRDPRCGGQTRRSIRLCRRVR
ncbi:glycosyltransferase [Acidobacteria bacterium ACD]|nr:glycosyltransferase [Acidobacteria bacterium ACD]